jgi:hypothetical protein
MGAPLLLLALLQGLSLTATGSVDRDRVSVGEEFTYTISSASDATGTLTLITPTFDGFEVVRRGERREVATTGRRTQVWEFVLRAKGAGKFTLGPAQVVQGGIVAETGAVAVEVVTQGTGLASQLNPRLRELLLAATPPRDSGPFVSVLLSAERAVVGEQVDIVTLAWFPRELRLRLRRQPTLEPPGFSGVWNYPQVVPPGIAATKQIGDVWYDLFVYHQVVFPITPGTVQGTPAVLRFSVPLAFQFFSQEERYELKSAIPRLGVLALPDDGRPAGFDGAVGHGLTLTREVDGPPRVGEPVGVRFVLSGRGNVSLWPPPFVRWPEGVQIYPEGTDEKLDIVGGVLGGTKTFRFLVVPDSSGILPIPTVTYHFYDPEPATYQSAVAPGVRVPVAPALVAVASRAEPPALLLRPTPQPSWRVAHALPWWGWGVVWLLPVAIYGISLLPRREGRSRARAVNEAPWLVAQHRLDAALQQLGANGAADQVTLVRALRTAGADAALADRVVAVLGRLGAERFAPTGGGVPRALLEEVRAVVGVLERLGRRGRIGTARVGAIIALLSLATPLTGQQVPPERLYETGAFRSAMEGYHTRAAAAPEVVANWYGLGASAYRLGEDGTAAAAWIRAARLAPRSRALTRALLLVPAPDPMTATWRGVLPVTGEEFFLAATLLWVVAWGGVALSGRWRGRWIVVVSGALFALLAAGWVAREGGRPLGLVTVSAPLRVSPHGRAPGSRELPVGTAVRPTGTRADWTVVRAATGEVGWIPTAQVAWVRE